MSVNLSPIGGAAAQFFDSNGNPLAGGKLYTYAAGTTTPLATYTTSVGNVAHTNPIILDSAGRVPGGQIWLTDGSVDYKFLLETSFSVLVGTFDNIPSTPNVSASDIAVVASTYNAGTTVQAQLTNVGSTTGATNVGYLPAGAGAVARTVEEKLLEIVSGNDFDLLPANISTAINKAILHVATLGGGLVTLPYGVYTALNTIIVPSNVTLDLGNSLITGPGVGSATDLFQSGYYYGGAVLANIGTPLNTRAVSKMQIRNAQLINCGKALNVYNCIDLCEFSNIRFQNCTYAVYSDNCFYARFINLFSRDVAAGATNAAFFFINNVNVLQLESIFVTDRVLGFQIQNSPHGLKMLNCSAEQCQEGVHIVGDASNPSGPIMFDTCYFEGINNYGVNFDFPGAKWNITFDNCWFLFVGIAIKTSTSNTQDEIEIRRSNKFLEVTTIVDFTGNPFSGNNHVQLQQQSIADNGTALLPSGYYVNRRSNVDATTCIYDSGPGTPLIKTKVHGVSLIAFEHEGDAGTVKAGTVPFCTTIFQFGGLYVYTKIAYDEFAAQVVYKIKITTGGVTYIKYGNVYGDVISERDAVVGHAGEIANLGGYLVIIFTEPLTTGVVTGIVRHV